MFGVRKAQDTVLKPYVFKIREGFLVGVAAERSSGSPCQECLFLWLRERDVWVEKAQVSDLIVRRDILAELLVENSPHTQYEISKDGIATRLDGLVFPHPQCECWKNHSYTAPTELSKKTNFAFTPLTQIKSVRLGTPSQSLWLTSVGGQGPLSRKVIQASAVETDREASRQSAIAAWMKSAAYEDLRTRIQSGESIASEVFQSNQIEILNSERFAMDEFKGMGAGSTPEAARLEALTSLARYRVIHQYGAAMKNPMLVVGSNAWIRDRVPFFLLQQQDLYLLFYPNAFPCWVVGVAAFSRQSVEAKPIFVFASGTDINQAMSEALYKMVDQCRPSEWSPSSDRTVSDKEKDKKAKLHQWWTNWIYRSPKISLKDVLHLENYSHDLAVWKGYFSDGQDPVHFTPANHPLLPFPIRRLVKLSLSKPVQASPYSVRGIGTFSHLKDGLI